MLQVTEGLPSDDFDSAGGFVKTFKAVWALSIQYPVISCQRCRILESMLIWFSHTYTPGHVSMVCRWSLWRVSTSASTGRKNLSSCATGLGRSLVDRFFEWLRNQESRTLMLTCCETNLALKQSYPIRSILGFDGICMVWFKHIRCSHRGNSMHFF